MSLKRGVENRPPLRREFNPVRASTPPTRGVENPLAGYGKSDESDWSAFRVQPASKIGKVVGCAVRTAIGKSSVSVRTAHPTIRSCADRHSREGGNPGLGRMKGSPPLAPEFALPGTPIFRLAAGELRCRSGDRRSRRTAWLCRDSLLDTSPLISSLCVSRVSVWLRRQGESPVFRTTRKDVPPARGRS